MPKVSKFTDEQAFEKSSVSMIKSLMRKLLIVIVVLFLCGIIFLIYKILLKPTAPELFRQYVLDPIPASVTNIKVDQPKTFGGYGYVFRFDIKRVDLDLIVKSRSFWAANITDFMGGGGLYWGWKGPSSSEQIVKSGHGFTVYHTRRRKPSWYTLESWDSPEAYVLVQEVKDVNTSDIQVLVYNEEIGQAFFIVFDYGEMQSGVAR